MKKEKRVDPDKIQVLNIRTVKGNISGTADVSENMIGGHHFNFELGTGVDLKEKIVGLQLTVDITVQDKEGAVLDLKGSYTHEIIFSIENLEEFVTEESYSELENKQFTIDGMLGSVLVSIAYSTIRGIIFIRTQGTSLGSVILPIVDPKKLMGIEL